MAEPQHVVAIDAGGTSLKAALVDRGGSRGPLHRVPTRIADGPGAVVEQILELAATLAAEAGGVAAAGIAVPGIVSEATGTAVYSANIGWRDVPFAALAAERLDVPIAFGHDARAAAVAEGEIGAARGVEDFLLLTLGTGVGAAAVVGGVPHTGAHALGGELGHVTVEPRGPVCGCGNRGCLEALASAAHVARRYRAMTGDPDADASAVAARAAAGDPAAAAVWTEAIDALVVAISGYAQLLDPALVLIGGGMADAGEALLAPLRCGLGVRLRLGPAPEVVRAGLGPEAGCVGAAILAWRAVGVG